MSKDKTLGEFLLEEVWKMKLAAEEAEARLHYTDEYRRGAVDTYELVIDLIRINLDDD